MEILCSQWLLQTRVPFLALNAACHVWQKKQPLSDCKLTADAGNGLNCSDSLGPVHISSLLPLAALPSLTINKAKTSNSTPKIGQEMKNSRHPSTPFNHKQTQIPVDLSSPSLCKPAAQTFIVVLPLSLSVCVFTKSCFPAPGTKGVQKQ